MRIFWALALAVTAGLAAIGTGNAKILDCSFPILASNNGWISDRAIFVYDDKAGTATVIDAIINYYFKKPVAAKVRVISTRQTAFSWAVQTRNDKGQYASMQYRATLFANDNSMIMAATPPGYANTFEAHRTRTVKAK